MRTRSGMLAGLLLTLAAPAAHAGCELGAGADPAAAAQAQAIGAALPLSFVGSFRWDGAADVQPLTVAFSACVVGGSVRLVGEGHYLDSDTRIDVIADVKGGAVVLVERNPRGGIGAFLTAGRHRGEIAPDLSRICATWTTDGTGETGQLALGRTPEDAAACGALPEMS